MNAHSGTIQITLSADDAVILLVALEDASPSSPRAVFTRAAGVALSYGAPGLVHVARANVQDALVRLESCMNDAYDVLMVSCRQVPAETPAALNDA